MSKRTCLLHIVLAILIGLGSVIGAAPRAAQATEAVDSANGWYVEVCGETKWVQSSPTETKLVKRIRVKRTKGQPESVSLTLTRDPQTTTRFGIAAPPLASGGGTATIATWWVTLDAGQTWEATIEEYIKPGLPAGTSIANRAQLGTGPEVVHYTPLASSPPNSTTAANPGVQDTGDPVNAATGEQVLGPMVDLNLGGPLPLVFRRYYAAGLKDEDWAESALGGNWLHNFDLYLPIHFASEVTAVYEGGKVIEFVRSYGNTGWSLNHHQEPVRYWLARGRADATGNFWLLDPERELVFRFDDETGRLQEIQDRNGNRLTLSRDAQGKLTQVADGLGRALTFTYNANRQLTRVSDGTRNVNFTYDAHGHLATAQDATGQTTVYSYAADRSHGPLLTGLTRPAGNTPTTQLFNAAGQVISQSNAYGNTTAMAYAVPAAGQTQVTRPDATMLEFTHQDLRMTTAVQDPAGKTYAIEFNDREQPVTHRDRLGDTTSVTYDEETGSRKIASYTDAEGNTTTFSYETRMQVFTNPTDPQDFVFLPFFDLQRVTYADGSHEDFTYDARGNVTAYTDRAGQTWTFAYNARGQVLTATNPQAAAATYTYHADGTLASASDPEVGVTTFGYDALRRLNLVTRPGGATARFTYDLNDRLLTATDELGQVTTFTYDANGNLATAADPLNQTVTLAYDLMDRLRSSTDPVGQTASLSYDAMGRLATATDRNGNTMTYAYDPRGWPNAITDPAGKTWRIAYDDEGVPTAFTTPLGRVTAFQTDKLGRTTRITDPLGSQTTISYNALGQPTSVTDRLGRVTSYAYDAAGRLTGVTEPIGAASYAYTELGLLSRITDPRGKEWDFSYSAMGRPTSQTDPLGNQWTYTYDARGRPSQITYPGGGAAAFTYDSASQITQVAYPGGPTLNYTYDVAGRLLTAGAGGATPPLQFTYDARGNVTDSQDGGASFGATYDDGQRLTSVTYDGEATVTYTYDSRDLLTRVEDSRSGAWITFTYDDDDHLIGLNRSNGVGTTYTYDAAGRVTRIQDVGAQGPAPLQADQQYTLNAEGEPTQVARALPLDPPPAIGQVANLSYNDAGQISSPGYAYDVRGRQTAAPGKTFAYDGTGQLTQVSNGGETATFTYNGLGDLRTRTADGATTTYCHNYALGLAPIVAEAETGGQGDKVAKGLSPSLPLPLSMSQYKRFYVYTPGGALLYSIDPATDQARFYHFDRVGSTLFLTDGAGSVSDAYAYDPYGNLLGRMGASDQPFTYVGQYGVRREPVGDLYDMRARAYDPSTARFLTRDPVWPVLAELQSLNPYQYAHENPLRYVDPQGTLTSIGAVQWALDAYLMWYFQQVVTAIEIFGTGEDNSLLWLLKQFLECMQVRLFATVTDTRITYTPDIAEWTAAYLRSAPGRITYTPDIAEWTAAYLRSAPGRITYTPDIAEWTAVYRKRAPGCITYTPDITEWERGYLERRFGPSREETWSDTALTEPRSTQIPTSQRESTTKFNGQVTNFGEWGAVWPGSGPDWSRYSDYLYAANNYDNRR